MAHVFHLLRGAALVLSRAAVVSLALVPLAHAQFVNDPTGEPASANQSRPSLAQLDGVLVAAFADFRPGVSRHMHCSYSLDSGATWIALGEPPAWGTSRWMTDPTVVASPVHGKFFVFGGANDYPVFGALYACVSLSFPGGVPTWGTPRLVRVTAPDSYLTYNFAHAAAVSPATGRLFATSLFDNGTDPVHLGLQYSDDEGQTWSLPLVVPDSASAYPLMRVHGNYVYVMNGTGTPACLAVTPAAGPSWWNLGVTPKARDAMTPGLGVSGWPNTFTICPWPGAYEGRIYAAWTESYDFEDDPVPDPLAEATPVSEAEPNGTFAEAASFAPGDVLRGEIATSNTDLDYFRIHLDAGQRLILWPDSAGAAFNSLNLQAYDSLGLRPAWYDGQIQRGGARLTFVAPRTDEYGFRFSGALTTGSPPQGYRVRTAPGYAGSEPALDQSDVVAAWSDDGGTTWSTPVRVTTTAVGVFDDGPVITAGPEGGPVGGWWWRTPTNGVYGARWRLLRSLDGGNTWQLGLPATTTPVTTNWSAFSGTAMGGNAALALPDRIVHAFAELQVTTPLNTDIRAVTEYRALEALACAGEYAGRPGDSIYPMARLRNTDAYFTEPVEFVVGFDRDWPTGRYPSSILYGADGWFGFSYTIPDTAAPGDVRIDYGVVHLGAGVLSCPSTIHVQPLTDVGDGAPLAFGLSRAWPNPARGRTTLRYGISHPAWATLDVLDVGGRRVARLADRLHEPGAHEVSWDGRGPGGGRLPAGLYLLELRSDGRRDVARLVWLE